ncbi:hypothetical protein V7S43_016059 [Phytophthora oleae]|uniref:Uncharacterized protein n=1 Tax=Phytophthora oleae TaxID=2107226 RepID=A0ABD3EWK9_9STRA
MEKTYNKLTHMAYESHSQTFYMYLDELKQDIGSLTKSGLVNEEVSGEEGVRVGVAGLQPGEG